MSYDYFPEIWKCSDKKESKNTKKITKEMYFNKVLSFNETLCVYIILVFLFSCGYLVVLVAVPRLHSVWSSSDLQCWD